MLSRYVMDTDHGDVISCPPRMLPATVVMAPVSTLTFEDRSEVRGRTTSPKIAADAETDPALKYTALWRNGTDVFTIFYNPRLLYLDIAGGAHDLEALNGGGAALGFYQGRTSFQIGTVGQYGTIASSSLIMPERWQGQGAPKTYYSLPQPPPPTLMTAANGRQFYQTNFLPTLTYVASYSNASFVQQLSRRWSLTVNAQYGLFGGPNAAARQQLPLVYGPTAEVKIEHNYTRNDDIDVTGGVHYSATHSGDTPATTATDPKTGEIDTTNYITLQPEDAVVGYGEARLKHRWSTVLTSEIAAGAAVAHQAFPALYESTSTDGSVNPYAGRPATIPYPTGELLTVYGAKERARLQMVGVARITPWFDPFGGVNEERSEFAIAANVIAGKNTIRLQASFYHTLPTSATPGNYTLAIGELAVEHKLSKTVGFDCGLRFEGQTFVEQNVNVFTTSTMASAKAMSVAGPQQVEIARNHESFVEGIGFIGLSWLPTPLKL